MAPQKQERQKYLNSCDSLYTSKYPRLDVVRKQFLATICLQLCPLEYNDLFCIEYVCCIVLLYTFSSFMSYIQFLYFFLCFYILLVRLGKTFRKRSFYRQYLRQKIIVTCHMVTKSVSLRNLSQPLVVLLFEVTLVKQSYLRCILVL